MPYATITLELYKSGIRFHCEDCEHETFIPRGNGDMLMDAINLVDAACDPDSIFEITEKGRETIKNMLEELK